MDEIILDKSTFKALAVDTRVNILKFLKGKRKTGSDIAKYLKLSKPTVLEHLNKMVSAGLLIKKPQGKKWIYYELTLKGEKILSPTPSAFFVFMMTVSLALIVFGSMNVVTIETFTPELPGIQNYVAGAEAGAEMPAMTAAEDVINTKAETSVGDETPKEDIGMKLNYEYLVLILAGLAVMIFGLKEIIRF
jgi:DNA-binding transcriptional ArsR family regulator